MSYALIRRRALRAASDQDLRYLTLHEVGFRSWSHIYGDYMNRTVMLRPLTTSPSLMSVCLCVEKVLLLVASGWLLFAILFLIIHPCFYCRKLEIKIKMTKILNFPEKSNLARFILPGKKKQYDITKVSWPVGVYNTLLLPTAGVQTVNYTFRLFIFFF